MAQSISTDRAALDAKTVRSNLFFLYMEIGVIAIAFAMEWYYLQVFALRLGAEQYHLGIMSAARALMLALGPSLASPWLRRYRNIVTAMGTPMLIYRTLLYLFVAAVPFLPDAPGEPHSAFRVWALVGLVIMSGLPHGMAQAMFLTMLPTSIPKSDLPGVVRGRSALMNGVILISVFIWGQLMEHLPIPGNYQVGFFLSYIAALVGWWGILRIRVPDIAVVPEASQSKPMPIKVWAYAPFRRFMIVLVAVHLGKCMSDVLIQPYLVKQLHASDGWISFIGMIEMGAGALFTLVMARLQRRFSVRMLLIAMSFTLILQPLVLALTPVLPPYLLGGVAFGVGWFVINILFYSMLVEIVPEDKLAPFAAVFQAVINFCLFIGPLISTALLNVGIPIQVMLLIIAAERLGAFILTIFVRIERQEEPKTRLRVFRQTR